MRSIADQRSICPPRMGLCARPRAYGTAVSHLIYATMISRVHGVQSESALKDGWRNRNGRLVLR